MSIIQVLPQTRREAQTLAQLRTGHSRLQGFLAKIGIKDDPERECGEAVKTVRHFLLHCQRFQRLRLEMIEEAQDQYGDLSYMLGGRSRSRCADGTWLDGPVTKWKWEAHASHIQLILRDQASKRRNDDHVSKVKLCLLDCIGLTPSPWTSRD